MLALRIPWKDFCFFHPLEKWSSIQFILKIICASCHFEVKIGFRFWSELNVQTCCSFSASDPPPIFNIFRKFSKVITLKRKFTFSKSYRYHYMPSLEVSGELLVINTVFFCNMLKFKPRHLFMYWTRVSMCLSAVYL